MLVLALDTTTAGGSCAVVRDGRLLAEAAGDATTSHAARLPADLQGVLRTAGAAVHEVDLFAVATGPGSFTGLRVGIATMQGLALASRRPLVGVSAFDALARIVSDGLGVGATDVRIATWVEAWRGEVYAARYHGAREVEAPSVAPPAAILDRLAALDDGPTVFVGGGAGASAQVILDRLGARARMAAPVAPLVAATVARLALETGERPGPAAVRPVYVRRPGGEGHVGAR